MGGMFKAVTPTSPKPAQPASQPAPQPLATAAAPEPAATESERRKEALTRRQAGRAGTIATSSRGLLTSADWSPARKSLLGE